MASRMIQWFVVAALLPSLGSCGGDDGKGELLVELRTDYVGGVEVTRALTSLYENRGLVPIRTVEAGLVDEDLTRGTRIAELADLSPGLYRAEVSLSGAVPTPTRTLRVEVSGSIAITAVITRNCEGRSCPPDGAPDLTTCQGGICISPECRPDMPATCPPPDCIFDADCSTEVPCAEPACLAGSCSARPTAGTCAADEYCDPSTGCRPRPESPDAGAPIDGGDTDAGGSDGGSDAGATDAGSRTDGGFVSACGAPPTTCTSSFLWCENFESMRKADNWVWSCVSPSFRCDDWPDSGVHESRADYVSSPVCAGSGAWEGWVLRGMGGNTAYWGTRFPHPITDGTRLSDTFWVRLYFRVPATSDSDGKRILIVWPSPIGDSNTLLTRTTLGVGSMPGDLALWVNGAPRVDFPAGMRRDAWECLEVKMAPDEIEVWLNGGSVHRFTGATRAPTGVMWGNVGIGMIGGRPMPTTLQIDEMIIDDARIGCAPR